jgi:two-component system, NarL family, nitrate/nitrite response regulator NarL
LAPARPATLRGSHINVRRKVGSTRPDEGRRHKPVETGRKTGPAAAEVQNGDLSRGEIAANNARMKLLVVDDHAILREGLVALLQQFEQGADVLQASDTTEGLRLAEAHPDLDAVFLDLNMPGQGGMEAIPVFAKRCPQLPVIVLSSSEDPGDVRLALKSGAFGYVPKSASPRNILSALRLVLAGEIYVPPLMLDLPPAATGISGSAAPDAGQRLTERQTEVLRQLCLGLTNKEISRTLDLSEKTTKSHITAIFKALGVVNRTQAAAAARRAGIVTDANGANPSL